MFEPPRDLEYPGEIPCVPTSTTQKFCTLDLILQLDNAMLNAMQNTKRNM